MALQTIQPQQNGSTRFEATYVLEGRRYGFRWYTTGVFLPYWYLDVFQADLPTENVVTGIKMAVGVDLLCMYHYKGIERIPPGILYVQDQRRISFDPENQTFSNQPGFDPGVDAFSNGTYALLYLESQDVAIPEETS